MEPVGLAVGLMGLAGLFNSCLEAVERFDSWKNFGEDSRSLATHFEAEKLRLERWGQKVGFCDGVIPPEHHEALDDSRVVARVREHLSIIKKICSNADGAPGSANGTSAGFIKHGLLLPGRSRPRSNTPSGSKNLRIKWALRDKLKCTEQVQKFGQLVQDLHNLVPPDGLENLQTGDRNDAFADMKAEIQQILLKINSGIEAETREDLHEWLLGGYVPNELYDDAVQRRLPGTCDWILNRPTFLDWASPGFPVGSPKLLWINGPAGFGKTVLCAKLVEHLSSMADLPIAYFFFSSDYESHRDPFIALRSWLSQAMIRPDVFELVRQGRGTDYTRVATRSDIVRIFREVVLAIPGCTFIIDGLDECIGIEENWNLDGTTSVPNFLETVQQAVANTTTRIMITSRDEPEIRHCLMRNASTKTFVYKIYPKDVQTDAESYSRSIVDRRLHNKDETIKSDIAEKLAGRCCGQFLWLKMQEPSLRSGKNKKQLETAIDKTPTGLDRLYDRNWERILTFPDDERKRAFSLLRWAAFAVRPLTVSEITEAVLIDEDIGDLSVDEMPDSIDENYIDSEILELCGSLVEIRSVASEPDIGLRTVHLTHFSVKQYFMSKMRNNENTLLVNERLRSSNEAFQNILLAKLCLHYVNIPGIWEDDLGDSMNQIPRYFREYAGTSWYQHARAGDPNDPEVTRLANVLLDASNINWDSWRKRIDPNYKGPTDAFSPLCYASRFGLTGPMKYLLHERKHSVNEKGTTGRTALEISCANGHIDVVEILLDAGADISLASDDGWAPLSIASANGHSQVVSLLLENGADAAAADNAGWTPLIHASYQGHVEVVKLLLEKEADFTVTNNNGRSPLDYASYAGHVEVVKLLLEKGADFTQIDNDGWTPLYPASWQGHGEVVKLLLENGADFAQTDKNGWTPLHAASWQGHVEVVKLLLENGADFTQIDNDGWTPLHPASWQGHVEVAKLLLEKGATVMATEKGSGWSPLLSASEGEMLEWLSYSLKREPTL